MCYKTDMIDPFSLVDLLIRISDDEVRTHKEYLNSKRNQKTMKTQKIEYLLKLVVPCSFIIAVFLV